MTITSLDGYRWLKNDIIRGNFQPDEKLRMSLLTSRYALGVGPLREALYRFIWLRRTVLSVEMLEDKHDQHQTLTATVLARDTARASELMRQHLLTPIPIIQQAMAGN